jgi:RimJ/RimL family protein N-acetyltransferase
MSGAVKPLPTTNEGQPVLKEKSQQFAIKLTPDAPGVLTAGLIERSTGFPPIEPAPNLPAGQAQDRRFLAVKPFRGKGYAVEAGRAMLRFVFERSSLDRIYATIDPENSASIKVAGKIGFNFARLEIEEDGTRVGCYVIERHPKS